MSGALTEPLEVAELHGRSRTFGGRLRVSDFPRLAGLVRPGACDECAVDVQLTIASDEDGLYIEGRIEGKLELTCQRCLGPLAWHIGQPVRLGLMRSEEALACLPEGVEGELLAELDGGQGDGAGQPRLVLSRLVEEELLLAVPLAPMHGPDEACRAQRAVAAETAAAGRRPFAALAELKSRGRGSRKD